MKTNLYFFVTPTILDDDEFADLAELTHRKKLEASRSTSATAACASSIRSGSRHRGAAATWKTPGATIEDISISSAASSYPHYNEPVDSAGASTRLPIEELENRNSTFSDTDRVGRPPRQPTDDQGR